MLITGGAGFIGSHLAKALLMAGNRIFIIDNFNNYYDPWIKHHNVDMIKEEMQKNNIDPESLSVMEGDIRDIVFLLDFFNHHSVDVIIHLAAMAGVRPSIDNPLCYVDVNIKGTANLLEAARENHIRKFIFASSSSVYGNSKKVPFSETDNVNNPISPYAATKKSGELLCYTYHHLYKIDCACLRFFTVYGPGQRPDLAIHKFTGFIDKGLPVPVYGDGSSERDYTYIDDIVAGIMGAADWIWHNEKVFEIINLGHSRTIRLKALIQTIEKELGKKAIIHELPLQPGDVLRTYADISKANSLFGYQPRKSFEEGISEFIKWYRKIESQRDRLR